MLTTLLPQQTTMMKSTRRLRILSMLQQKEVFTTSLGLSLVKMFLIYHCQFLELVTWKRKHLGCSGMSRMTGSLSRLKFKVNAKN